ncbi:MAG: 4Fe-4S dicluster domain-containing protein [Pseudomonadota bacterium]|nr:4Fe-4S dicluster domain-containing protein [Pseudomonadota bacterium]
MVIDIDRCTGCQACVVACQAENNIALNDEQRFVEHRAKEWIRIERYWEGTFPDVKVRFLPVLCQQCGSAPCEPVCPVDATGHSEDGLNMQVYNRCVGTRYCGNNCPYSVRYFNFWQPEFPPPLNLQLNPDVTQREVGVMEKCTFCVQRLNRARRTASRAGRLVQDGEVQPACVQACPTNTLVFGNWRDPSSRINQLAGAQRSYKLLEDLGTEPAVVYLKSIDPSSSPGAEIDAEPRARPFEVEGRWLG